MHPCGTARAGRDPGKSVPDPCCKVGNTDKLHVVDASFRPSVAGLTPTRNLVAQAPRAPENIPGAGACRCSDSAAFTPGAVIFADGGLPLR